jgi:hypothetical protein
MSEDKPNTYEFTLLLAGPDLDDEDNFEAASAATGDLALFGRRGNAQFADFSIEAASYPDAVITAIRQLDEQFDGPLRGLRVISVEPEDLVSQSGIAERTGRSRQNISQLVNGQRGTRSFPAPSAWATSSSPLWRWSEVSAWFAAEDQELVEDALIAEFTAVVNARLHAREHRRRLQDLAKRHRELAVSAFTNDAALSFP